MIPRRAETPMPRPGEPEIGKLLSDAIEPLGLDEDDHMSAVQMSVDALLAKGYEMWRHDPDDTRIVTKGIWVPTEEAS